MKKHILNLSIATALTFATTGCVDVQEAKDAAIEVIDHAAETATEVGSSNSSTSQITADANTNTNTNTNTSTTTLSWKQQEEHFWTQPLDEILKDIKASGALEHTVTTCGAGTEAPSYYRAPAWAYRPSDPNSSAVSRDAALLLSCHAEWQSRYVARLFPEYVTWIDHAEELRNPFLRGWISDGPVIRNYQQIVNKCSGGSYNGELISDHICYYPDWTAGLEDNDLYVHALWFDSEYSRFHQNDYGIFEINLLSSENNWKGVLQHYLHETGTREVRSIALDGLATRGTHHYDRYGNRIYGSVTGTWNQPTSADIRILNQAFTATDSVMYKVGTYLGW